MDIRISAARIQRKHRTGARDDCSLSLRPTVCASWPQHLDLKTRLSASVQNDLQSVISRLTLLSPKHCRDSPQQALRASPSGASFFAALLDASHCISLLRNWTSRTRRTLAFHAQSQSNWTISWNVILCRACRVGYIDYRLSRQRHGAATEKDQKRPWVYFIHWLAVTSNLETSTINFG